MTRLMGAQYAPKPMTSAQTRQNITKQLKRPAARGARCERIVRSPQMQYCGAYAREEIDGVPYCPAHMKKGLAAKR